jgi:UDP-N-acetylglucosamine diphosphorylase / glucose-1-phosphate thymidylyltransferase / UDP-N-acetylgalactosamine diphosphorylase / glucosamine-1-phosphate N-acetyltransferase / galactosamine-1-phosphate N-acetyltransferase
MKATIIDAGNPASCQPVTCNRLLSACPVANKPLLDVQKGILLSAGFELADRMSGLGLYINGDAWLSKNMLTVISKVLEPMTIRDNDGSVLAWIGDSSTSEAVKRNVPADEGSFRIRYPWDILRVNELVIGDIMESRVEGEVNRASHVDGRLILGRGSRILSGVIIEGTLLVGTNCKIGPNCYIRGYTSIGDDCHIGHAVEIKNSLIMQGSSIGHLSYCGDSIICERVNFGAGTITANFRHDGLNHRSMVNGELLNTGRRKFGTVMGDNVHTGIHTSIYPGRKLWPNTVTVPGAVVSEDI